MKRSGKLISTLIIVIILFSQCDQKKDFNQQLTDYFNKKDVTILVTDSGLGGLSVVADLTSRLHQGGVFENVSIIYFNSQFHSIGYNGLKTEVEKVQIFNIALKAMKAKYDPDMLLIACNTLSVLYDKTPFSKSVSFPVIGIVEIGVDLIAKQFDRNPEATAIIFATKTTIGSNSHKSLLINQGYSENQIVGQVCPRLAGCIERGYKSDKTVELIRKYVTQALENIYDASTPIFASFNCTHYGYSIRQFKDVFAEAGYPEIEIIDPNPEMANFMFEPQYLNRFPETNVALEVVSKLKINEKKINSLGDLLQLTSSQTAEALRNYQFDVDLFDAKFDSTKYDK